MENPKKCSVGIYLNLDCHLSTYISSISLINTLELTENDKEVILLRTSIEQTHFTTICAHHNYYYTKVYETHERSCCDPTKCHKKSVKKALRTVSLSFARALIEKGFSVKPGQKLCTKCRKLCVDKIKTTGKSDSETEDPTVFIDEGESKQIYIDDANKSLDDLGCSPLKLHAVASHSKSSYGERKLKSVSNVLKRKISTALDYQVETSDSENEDLELLKKAKDFDKMIELLKDKVQEVNRSKKIQILTLAPPSWRKEKIMSEFNVSEYIVRQARKLKKEKGILSLPEPKKGKVIPAEVVGRVKEFFQNDEYSRILPGAKDKVSISKNVYMQKRLLLCNLNELFSGYKWEYPQDNIGFSKFCTLRPKWCISAGASGTHSVCVCSIHQNVKLLLDAIKIEETYKDLIKLLVCDSENSNCLLRHCDNCPSDEAITEFLENKLSDFDVDDEIEYTQWLNTDRPELVKQRASVEDFIHLLVNKLQKLIPHSFIAKSQAKTLKTLKENLSPNNAVLLMDFSENYSYTIQNEIQSYHWSRGSCTLHPVCVYLLSDGEQRILNHCFISDDLDHDVSFVNAVQREMMKWLKQHFPLVKKVHYFTDGCAGQYKNRKHFKNICEHINDFGINAEHSFFATSHGKSVCDGLGGTIKRTLRKASLQLPDDSQITTATGVFDFCQTNIEKIHFHYLSKAENDELRIKLVERFSQTKTVAGTRSFHHYKPISSDTLEIRRVTEAENPALIFSFKEDNTWEVIQPLPNSYVAAVYDDRWYFALVRSTSNEEGDADLLFLHPPGPANSFYWPQREDACYIPFDNILCTVGAPQTSSMGRTYSFTQKDLQLAESNLSKWRMNRERLSNSA